MLRILPVLPLLAACTVSAGEAPPEPVRIVSFEASPQEVAAGAEVTLTWEVTGPVRQLVLAIGDCACQLEADSVSFRDTCAGTRECACPCGGDATGQVLYTLTALGPEEDGTADSASHAVTVAP